MFRPELYERLAAELGVCAAEQSSLRLARCHSPEIRLLLVSKYQSRKAVYSALDYFKNSTPPNLGENYVQAGAGRVLELEHYYGAKTARRPQLELIGPLQSNKAAKAALLFSALHSVSSAKLLYALEKSRHKAATQNIGERLNIFLQYNASGEEQKNGCRSYDELRRLVEELLAHSRLLCLRGLMCMGAAGSGEAANRRAFAACRRMAEKLWQDFPPATTDGRLVPYFELSMGMSGDYREALAEGANVLRLGSLLFSS